MCSVCVVSTSRYCSHCGRAIKPRRPGADQDLIEFQLSAARQAKKAAAKRKCRSCRCALTSDRYFHCYACRTLRTEDRFDIFSAYERATLLEPLGGEHV